MRKLVEQMIRELNFGGFLRKQRSVTKLFPKFPERTANVSKKGGVRLNEMLPKGVWHFKVHSGTQDDLWYDVYMRFKNLPEMIDLFVQDKRLWKKDESGVKYNDLAAEIFNKVDLETDCSCPADCLVADTKIPLLNGKILTISELLQKYGKDKEFWVYSVDEKGNFIPGKAKHLGIIGQTKQLIKITLDNNRYFECTPEHRVMLRDGTYKKALELVVNESLMPLYFRLSEKTKQNKKGYLEVQTNTIGKKFDRGWKKVHTIVAKITGFEERETKNKELIETQKESYLVIHHKDLNPLNNEPLNLEWKGNQEHFDFHQKVIITALKEWYSDPENMKQVSEKFKITGRKNYIKYPEIYKKGNEAAIEFRKSDEGRKFTSRQMSLFWKNLSIEEKELIEQHRKESCNTKEFKQFSSKNMTNSWKTGKLKAGTHKPWLGLVGKKYSEETKIFQTVGKIMNVCFEILNHQLEVSWVTYQEFRKECSPLDPFLLFGDLATLNYFVKKAWANSFDGKYRGFEEKDLVELFVKIKGNKLKPKKCCFCGKDFETEVQLKGHINNYKRKCGEKILNNHKIRGIEILNLEVPVNVYDIAVEDSHNFLLDCGNIVHNSYWGPEYIKTQRKAQYGDQEHRPPRVRNPRQYSIHCKHAHNVFVTLPFYVVTLAGYLRKYYSQEVKKAEDKLRGTLAQIQQGTEFLTKKEAEVE